jgi:hypothetical protein
LRNETQHLDVRSFYPTQTTTSIRAINPVKILRQFFHEFIRQIQ